MQSDAKRIVQSYKTLKNVHEKDPMFVRRVFVSHYCNIPYHLLLDGDLYPRTLLEELYAASYHLIRNFELAPHTGDRSFEDGIIKRIENGEL